jgi:hypothetical protein
VGTVPFEWKCAMEHLFGLPGWQLQSRHFGRRKIPLCSKGSGFDAARLDYLIGTRTECYARRQRDRTLTKGDRVAVLGRGIAVVEHADETEVQRKD